MIYHFEITKQVLVTVVDEYEIEAENYNEAQEAMINEFNKKQGKGFVQSTILPFTEEDEVELENNNNFATRRLFYEDKIITTNADTGIY